MWNGDCGARPRLCGTVEMASSQTVELSCIPHSAAAAPVRVMLHSHWSPCHCRMLPPRTPPDDSSRRAETLPYLASPPPRATRDRPDAKVTQRGARGWVLLQRERKVTTGQYQTGVTGVRRHTEGICHGGIRRQMTGVYSTVAGHQRLFTKRAFLHPFSGITFNFQPHDGMNEPNAFLPSFFNLCQPGD